MPDMPNMQNFMQQAQELQKKLMDTQENIKKKRFEGASGGGLVKVVLSGACECLSIAIDSSLLVVEDKSTLEELIIAAFNIALQKIEDERNDATAALLPPGFKLPF